MNLACKLLYDQSLACSIGWIYLTGLHVVASVVQAASAMRPFSRSPLRSGALGLGLCYLNGLDRALDLASSAEDAVLLSCRVCLPNSKKGLSAVIRGSGVHSCLFAGYVHPVEDVCWADGYADAVGNTDVEIDPYCSTV